jgi:hypothetical protein
MRKIMFTPFLLLLGIVLWGCNNADSPATKAVQHECSERTALQVTEHRAGHSTGDQQRRFIIRDSVHDPLPPEAEAVQYFSGDPEPQPIPKAKTEDPIVLTRMPHLERENEHEQTIYMQAYQ